MMTTLLERPRPLRRKCALHQHLVGHPLVMQARRGHRIGDAELAVDHVADHLHHGRDDAAAAGRAGDDVGIAVLEHDGRRHRRQWPLAGPGRVGLAAGEAEGVWCAGLGGEIVELVVEQDAGAFRHQADAVAEVERVGVGHGVAEAVDHGEMCRVAALMRWRQRRPDLGGRPRVLGIDAATDLGRVILRDQPIDRHLDAGGVAEKRCPVGVSELHRLRSEMHTARIVGGEVGIALKDVEDLQQHHAAGRGRRHGDDIVSAVGATHRRPLDRTIVGEIVARHHAAGRLHSAGDLFRGRSLVEGARAIAGDARERVGEVSLQQRVAGGECLPVGLEEDLRARGPAPEPRLHARKRIGDIGLDREAVVRERDRRRQQVGEREFSRAILGMRERQACNGAGHADRQRRVAGLLRVGLTLVVEETVALDRGRCGLTIVDRGVDAALREMDHHVAAAADVAGARIGHRHGEGSRDCGIDGIAALLQHVNAHARRARFLRHHHAVARGRGLRRSGIAGGRWGRRD